jgi:CO/xanthine dehydrogenase FAD-binding subunit
MLLSNIRVTSPRSLDDALRILDEKRDKIRIIAGGSDMILQLKDGVVQSEELLNIRALERELRYVRMNDGEVHVGALATYSDIANSPLTQKHAPVLVEASRTVGAIQLQNTATIGGNLGNASPAADGVPPLYALDAKVVLASVRGRREVPVEEFFVGYRKKNVEPGELIEEVHFRAMRVPPESSVYMKLGLREANAISIVDAAIWASIEEKTWKVIDSRIALGAVAPTIVRARKAEAILRESSLDQEEALWGAAEAASDEAKPIDDLRGSAVYRRDMIAAMIFEGFQRVRQRRLQASGVAG